MSDATTRVPLYAEVFAPGSKDGRARDRPPLLLIHGWLMDRQIWSALTTREELAAWALYCPDLRGHGRSAGEVGITLGEHVDDLIDLVEAEGWREFGLVGHSMGGAIAMRLAERMPERISSITLISPVPMGGLPLPDEVYAQFEGIAGDAKAIRAFLEPQFGHVNDLDRFAEIAAACPPATVRNLLAAWTKDPHAGSLEALDCPQLVFAGELDPYISPALVRDAIAPSLPAPQVSIVRSCGHYAQVDRPDLVAETMADLLDT